MHRAATLAAAVSAALPAAAQGVQARLLANAPMTMIVVQPGTTYSGSLPAGRMAPSGSVTMPGAPAWAGELSWTTLPTGPGTWTFTNDLYAASSTPSTALLDCTLWLSHPAGNAFGDLHVEMFSAGDFVGTPTVDLFDDGAIDVALPGCCSSWYLSADVHLPVWLSPTPTPVRVRLAASVIAPLGHSIQIEWRPWVASAYDLATHCRPNLVTSAQRLEDYWLAALPGSGGGIDLVADGRGTLGTFVVATDPERLLPGQLGLGAGCDDLLLAPVLDTHGLSIDVGRWQLPVPPLPPGLWLYVQHVSLGIGYLGATNLVAFGT